MSEESLGTILRKCRTKPCKHCGSAKGLSLREVQDKTGISNAYLSQLESGKIKTPSPKILEGLADFYGVSYWKLMKAVGYKSK